MLENDLYVEQNNKQSSSLGFRYVVILKDENGLSIHRGCIMKIIESCDSNRRAVEANIYQHNSIRDVQRNKPFDFLDFIQNTKRISRIR